MVYLKYIPVVNIAEVIAFEANKAVLLNVARFEI